MSDERRDDEILGRALSRAIETIDVNQTPYERSRIAAEPARRSIFGLWQLATAVAAIALALAIGSWLTRPADLSPVAAPPAAGPPKASAPSAPSSNATTVPASAYPENERVWVYYARDGLAPVGDWARGSAPLGTSMETRIGSRVGALLGIGPSGPQVGTTNTLSAVAKNAQSGSPVGFKVAVRSDLATVDFTLANGWGVTGSAQSQALVQQLVYTITEEPGVRRVLIMQNGKSGLIDQLVVDKPLTREDVFGYSFRAAVGKDNGISWGGDDSQAHVAGKLQEVSPERVMLAGRSTETGAQANLPSFSIWLEQSNDTKQAGGKYALNLTFRWNGGDSSGGAANTATYAYTPLRSIASNGTNVYRLELDDARPWRAYMPDKTKLVIEIGGDPRATSDRIAVTSPQAGSAVPPLGNATSRLLRVVGAARVFEANVSWRIRDTAGKTVADGHFLASLGSSALWGSFDTQIPIAANVSGNATLELYEASPKDGSEQGLVAIPLMIR